MWAEESAISPKYYKKSVVLSRPYPFIKINGIPKFGERETRFERGIWKGPRKSPEKKIFGISMVGIKAEREEISIDPEKLRTNVFYLFSHKSEKYVARKTDENVVEIFEVIE